MTTTLDEEIAALERELEVKRAEKAKSAYAIEIAEHTKFFASLVEGNNVPVMSAAVDCLRVARRRYDRVPHNEPKLARTKGTGAIQRNGNGWRWKLGRITSKAWTTRAEAEEELSKVLADPLFVPAIKDHTPVLESQRKQHCSKCGLSDHRAPDCPTLNPPPSQPLFPIEPSRLADSVEALRYVHPGNGWGPVEEGGLVKHLLCKGKGMISHDNGNGKVTKEPCKPCNGQGFKRCLKRHT